MLDPNTHTMGSAETAYLDGPKSGMLPYCRISPKCDGQQLSLSAHSKTLGRLQLE